MSGNQKLLLAIVILSGLICLKLYLQASLDANWKGFYFSCLHVAIIALGTFFGLRLSEKDVQLIEESKEATS